MFVCFTGAGQHLYYAQGNIEWQVDVVGFPFIWMMDGVYSISLIVAVIPLIANFGAYFFISTIAIYPMSSYIENRKRIRYSIWVIALLLVIPWFGIFMMNDQMYHLFFDTKGYEVKLINYHFVFYGIVG